MKQVCVKLYDVKKKLKSYISMIRIQLRECTFYNFLIPFPISIEKQDL